MPTYHRFIPVRRKELVRRLRQDFGFHGDRAHRFNMFVDLLYQLYRYSYDGLFNQIKECYYPFNPDRDTVTLDEFDPKRLRRCRKHLCELFEQLMNLANYECMSREDFEKYVRERPVFGLQVKVDTSQYEELHVYYRGGIVRQFEQRNVRKWFRKECIDVDCFQRLIILIKVRGDPEVVIKLFKDVPASALEMMLPKVNIKMSVIDKLKLGGSGAAGIIGGSVRIALRTLRMGSLTFAIGVALIAAGGYAVKTFLGFKKLKEMYFSNLARRLYFSNLDNNLGVIRSAIDMAVEEELEEAILAWCILDQEKEMIPREEVDRRAEAYLTETYGVDVDFEIGDAIDKLIERQLLIETPEGLSVKPLEESLEILDGKWDGLYVPPSIECPDA